MGRVSLHTKLSELRDRLLKSQKPVLLVLHNYPDPDCIAAALGIQALFKNWGVSSSISHGGGLGRSENKAMVGLLGLKLELLSEISADSFQGAFLADTQPGTGNNSLPENMPVIGVIDHHPRKDDLPDNIDFVDIRTQFGSSSTIVFKYIQDFRVPLTPELATALILGIKTDTENFDRNTSHADIEAFARLYPVADLDLLHKISRPALGDEYFNLLLCALNNATRYGEAVVAVIDKLPQPDWLSEVSELLIRGKGAAWALALGAFDGKLYLSLRIKPPRKNAASIVRRTVEGRGSGGGHANAAGGVIIPANAEVTQKDIDDAVSMFLSTVGVQSETGRSMCF